MENLCEIVMLPCNHVCVCKSCFAGFERSRAARGNQSDFVACPTCRAPAQGTAQLFLTWFPLGILQQSLCLLCLSKPCDFGSPMLPASTTNTPTPRMGRKVLGSMSQLLPKPSAGCPAKYSSRAWIFHPWRTRPSHTRGHKKVRRKKQVPVRVSLRKPGRLTPLEADCFSKEFSETDLRMAKTCPPWLSTLASFWAFSKLPSYKFLLFFWRIPRILRRFFASLLWLF